MTGLVRTVRMVSLMLEQSRFCTRALIVAFASGTTWYWTHLGATARIILSRVAMKSDITAFELAALHHELAVDALCSFSDLAAEKHRYFSDAKTQQLQELSRSDTPLERATN